MLPAGRAWTGNLDGEVCLLPYATTLSSRAEEETCRTHKVGDGREGNWCGSQHPCTSGGSQGSWGIRQIMPLVRTGDCSEGEV